MLEEVFGKKNSYEKIYKFYEEVDSREETHSEEEIKQRADQAYEKKEKLEEEINGRKDGWKRSVEKLGMSWYQWRTLVGTLNVSEGRARDSYTKIVKSWDEMMISNLLGMRGREHNCFDKT